MFIKILFLLCALENILYAAACCSGSNALPAFITTDDKWLLGVGTSYSKIIGDVAESGDSIFRRDNEEQINLTHKVETSYMIKEGFQAGLVVPVQQRQQRNSTYKSQISDVRASTFYEFLPEYTYSKWKPRGFVYFVVTFPTGESVYESDQSEGLNSFGKGFYSVGIGNFWLKRWNILDANFFYQLGYSVPRSFQDREGMGIKVYPGFAATASIGSGLNFGNYRVGLRVQPNYLQRKKIITAVGEGYSASEVYWDTAVDFGFLPADYLSIVISYTDQTLLGPARNTTLSRTLGLSAQYRLGI